MTPGPGCRELAARRAATRPAKGDVNVSTSRTQDLSTPPEGRTRRTLMRSALAAAPVIAAAAPTAAQPSPAAAPPRAAGAPGRATGAYKPAFVPHGYPEKTADLGEVVMNYVVAGPASKPALLLIPGQ